MRGGLDLGRIALKNRAQLTKRQQLVLEGIIDYQNSHGFAPAIRELCVIAGLSSTSSVSSHLKQLEEKGYIARMPEAPRAIAIL